MPGRPAPEAACLRREKVAPPMPDRPAAPAPSPPTDPPAGAPSAYATPRAALFGAMREALGAPVLVLAASYLGFGSFARSSDLTFGMAMTSTATGWALPGQIALVELYAVGASLMAIALAVALTNVRLLPMALALMPHLRSPGRPRWHYWAGGALGRGDLLGAYAAPRAGPAGRAAAAVSSSGSASRSGARRWSPRRPATSWPAPCRATSRWGWCS